MATKPIVQITAHFESNLEQIERFLIEADVPQAFDELLDELLETVIPNLEQFPLMGRPFFRRRAGSVEVTNALADLKAKLLKLTPQGDAIREYVLKHYLMLYAVIDGTIYLLAIRHQRQLSFDFASHGEHG